MTQIEYDMRCQEIRLVTSHGLSQIRKEDDADKHWHEKTLARLNVYSQQCKNPLELAPVKEAILDAYHEREQMRKERASELKRSSQRLMIDLNKEYAEWQASRESNRQAHADAWRAANSPDPQPEDKE